MPSWKGIANTTELVLPFAHPSPQLRRKIDRCSHLCIAHGSVSSGMSCPPVIATFACGIWVPSKTCLSPPESITQTASRSVQPFLHRSRQCCCCNGRPFPPKITPSHGDLDPIYHDSLGPSEPTTQTASQSVQPFLHR